MEDPRKIWSELIKLRESLKVDEGDFDNDLILKQLEGEGIEISSLDEIERHSSGALLYKGNPIIIYIPDTQKLKPYLEDKTLIRRTRTKRGVKEADKQPKFHFNWCDAINKMDEEGRFARYVIKTKRSDLFRVYARVKPYEDETYPLENIKLFVCRRCLEDINHEQYKNVSKEEKKDIVENFDIGKFLEKRDQKLKPFKRIPRHTDITVPRNRYTRLYYTMSEILKKEKKYCCSKCGVNMTEKPKGLHCHHKNGVRNDNRRSNLQILCASCHRNIDRHHKRVPVSKDIEEHIQQQTAFPSS